MIGDARSTREVREYVDSVRDFLDTYPVPPVPAGIDFSNAGFGDLRRLRQLFFLLDSFGVGSLDKCDFAHGSRLPVDNPG